jgi:hypothetical protein
MFKKFSSFIIIIGILIIIFYYGRESSPKLFLEKKKNNNNNNMTNPNTDLQKHFDRMFKDSEVWSSYDVSAVKKIYAANDLDNINVSL